MPRGVEAMSCQRIFIAIALLMQPALSFGEGGHKTFDLAEFQFEGQQYRRHSSPM